TATGQPIGQPLDHDDTVNSVAFSFDGARIATASYNKTIRLWDATEGREIGGLRGHETPALAVAFPPNGRDLGAARQEGNRAVGHQLAAAARQRRCRLGRLLR